MGYEYKLLVRELNSERAEHAMRSCPYFSGFDSEHALFNFHDPLETKGPEGWSSLVSKVDAGGIYLCHYGNKVFFEKILNYLKANFGEGSENFQLEEL